MWFPELLFHILSPTFLNLKFVRFPFLGRNPFNTVKAFSEPPLQNIRQLLYFGVRSQFEISSKLSLHRSVISLLRPRWSRGNMLVSGSKVRGFKPNWGHKNPESSGRDFKSLRLNQHIHVLVIPKFGEHNRS